MNLQTTLKYDIFTDFWNKNNFSFDKPYVVLDKYTKYFTPMTDEIKNYIEYYGFSIHYGYQSYVTPLTNIDFDTLAIQQFDIIYYNDKTEIRRLQDFYYEDSSNVYTKYNFNFDIYGSDFNLHGNQLLLFTDFTIRCYQTSGVILNDFCYGIPTFLQKYFLNYGSKLYTFLENYGVYSILPTSNNRYLYTIDYNKYLELNPTLNITIEEAPEYYIRAGQFELRPLAFNKIIPSQIDIIKSFSCIISNDISYGSGSLYKTGDGNIYLVTSYTLIKRSGDTNYFYASFQLKDPNSLSSTTTTAKFQVIGYDVFSEILIGLYDPTLSYNIVNNVDMSPYPISVIDPTILINIGDEIISIGNQDNMLSPFYGKIIDNEYTCENNEIHRPPSILLQNYVSTGCIGSPVFFNSGKTLDGKYPIIGMILYILQKSSQLCVSIQPIVFLNIIYTIISNYQTYSVLYSDNLVKYNNTLKYGFQNIWLGCDFEYWYPSSKQKYKELINLPYTGGILITNFILGFNFESKKNITKAEDLNRREVIELYGPLLEYKIYKLFKQNSNVPIVLVSISYFDSIDCAYITRYFGKYSNQFAYSYYLYGNQYIAAYNNDSKYLNPYHFEFTKIQIQYYYYNGSGWLLNTEIIGNNTPDWYIEYNDLNGSLFYQHKFEYPLILLDYLNDLNSVAVD
jgi:hypothetical protein